MLCITVAKVTSQIQTEKPFSYFYWLLKRKLQRADYLLMRGRAYLDTSHSRMAVMRWLQYFSLAPFLRLCS